MICNRGNNERGVYIFTTREIYAVRHYQKTQKDGIQLLAIALNQGMVIRGAIFGTRRVWTLPSINALCMDTMNISHGFALPTRH